MLPKEAIKEFKRLYAKNYGTELSDKESTRRANNLITLFRVVYDNNNQVKNEKRR